MNGESSQSIVLKRKNSRKLTRGFFSFGIFLVAVFLSYQFWGDGFLSQFQNATSTAPVSTEISLPHNRYFATSTPLPPLLKSISKPERIHAIYITAPMAGSMKRVEQFIQVMQGTLLNTVVINVKDEEGVHLGADMMRAVTRFREAGAYPIARIIVFQDSALVDAYPELALRASSTGAIWSSNGYKWVDPASRKIWEYIGRVSVEALKMGFEEINLDYIRFPSDGDLTQIVYPVFNNASSTKESVIEDFSRFVVSYIKKEVPSAVISADIFAQGLLSDTNLGIGQRFLSLAKIYDVIAPMIYPSHYAPGNFGFTNPAEYPYEVVRGTLEKGQELLNAQGITATIRPWIQDFDMGAFYNIAMVQKEIQAVKDAGIEAGWMVWNPRNVYEKEKFVK